MIVSQRKPGKAETSVAAAQSMTKPARVLAGYNEDFYRWTLEQAELLRAGANADLDIENIAEELETLGREEFRKLENTLVVILTKMLVSDRLSEPQRSLSTGIRIQRLRYGKILKISPSLEPRRDEALADAYAIARLTASSETNLPLRTFPADCPYTWQDILDRPFAFDPDDA